MRFLILTKRSLLCAALIALSAVLVAAGLGRQYQTSSASNTGERKIPVYCVDTNEKKIAITFDAAWGADDTDELLAILAEYNAKATVFAATGCAKIRTRSRRFTKRGIQSPTIPTHIRHTASYLMKKSKQTYSDATLRLKNASEKHLRLCACRPEITPTTQSTLRKVFPCRPYSGR